MKEFLFEQLVKDISKELDLTRKDICWVILNAELATEHNYNPLINFRTIDYISLDKKWKTKTSDYSL